MRKKRTLIITAILVVSGLLTVSMVLAGDDLKAYSLASVTGESSNPSGESVLSPNLGGILLIDQPPNQTNGLFADADCNACSGAEQSVAEDFILGDTYRVTNIVIWSGYFPADGSPTDDLRVRFLNNSGSNLPDTSNVLYDESSVPYSRTQTGVILFGVHEWMTVMTLTNPLELDAGTYWVEVFNDTSGSTDSYFWEVGDLDVANGRLNNAFALQTPGTTWNTGNPISDNALQIWGTLVTGNVPSVDISKTPLSQTVTFGGNANFTITVTNSGSVNLENVTVSDALVPDCDIAIGSLAVSTTVSYGCTDVGVINSYTNVVTVTSEYSGGLPGPSAMDTADVIVLVPDINVTPNNLSSSQFADEIMTDTITIENNGNLTLNWTLDEAPTDCNSPADVTWASATPTSGSIPGSGSTDVEVTFDSAGLSPGVYSGKLCIDSDDPDEPTVEVNLTLTVVVADINLNPTSLSSTQFMNEVMTETLAIENQGTGPLTWSISEAGSDCNSPGDVSWINVSPTSGTTNNGGSTNVDVGFDSTGLAHGVHTAKLCIDSNDPDEPQVEADLTLTVEERPIIMVSPGSLGGTLAQNEMMTQTLTISNTGDADLDWMVTEGSLVMEGGCGTPGNLPWVSVSPTSGSTPPGNSSDVTVVFDPTGLATGDYSGELCITSDAPDDPEVVVPLNLTVVEAEYFIYLPAVRRVDVTSAGQPLGLLSVGMVLFLPAAVLTWRRWSSQDF